MTSTRASSDPFAWRTRSSRAISSGGRSGSTWSMKSRRTPSVAKTTISPRSTGSCCGRVSGSSPPTIPPIVTSPDRVDGRCLPFRKSIPSTFPIPAQVMSPARVSKVARESTTPRAPMSAWCARRMSSGRGSAGRRASVTAASAAACAASGPWPSASITATMAPPGNSTIRWRSPFESSPAIGTVATPHSRVGPPVTVLLAMPFPFLHRDRRPLSGLRLDLEFVHQAPRTRETDAQPPGGREPVLEGARDIGDPGTVVPRDDDDPPPVVVDVDPQRDGPAAGVHQDVARDLAHRGRDDRLVAGGESRLRGLFAGALAGLDDVPDRRDLPADLVRHGWYAPARTGRGIPALPRGRGPWPRP